MEVQRKKCAYEFVAVMALIPLEVPPPIIHGTPHRQSTKFEVSQNKSRRSIIVQASTTVSKKALVVNMSKENDHLK